MYKQILFYLMLIGSASRALAIVLLAFLDKINLPVSVVLISAFVAAMGIFFVIKRLARGITLRELTIYHLTAITGILLSFILLRFSPFDISAIETVITGSVLSVIVGSTTLFLALRKKRYVTIRNKMEKEIRDKSKQEQDDT